MTGEFKDADVCRLQARTTRFAKHPEIDEAKLDELAEILSAERLEAMLMSYLSHARQQLTQMENLAADMNYAALAAEAHDLKGISGTFGAVRVQYLAEQLERTCQSSDVADAARILAEIRAASHAVSTAIVARQSHGLPAMACSAG
jgi:HPt (histidine-containing phosphotransfer) domain-containing protein